MNMLEESNSKVKQLFKLNGITIQKNMEEREREKKFISMFV